jgi:hypothetical protein
MCACGRSRVGESAKLRVTAEQIDMERQDSTMTGVVVNFELKDPLPYAEQRRLEEVLYDALQITGTDRVILTPAAVQQMAGTQKNRLTYLCYFTGTAGGQLAYTDSMFGLGTVQLQTLNSKKL